MHRKQKRKRIAPELSDQQQGTDSIECIVRNKEPKFDTDHESKERLTIFKKNIKVLRFTFDFGPFELNKYQYVFDGLRYIWKLPGVSAELSKPDDSFLLITDNGEDVEELCLDLFSSLPTCIELPSTNIEKDLPWKQPLLISLNQCILEEDIFRFLTGLTRSNDTLYFILEENTPEENRKIIHQKVRKDNILQRAKGANSAFYGLCYKILLHNVSKFTAVFSKKPNTRRNSHCLKLLKLYRSCVKEKAKPPHLKEEVVKKVDMAVRKATPEYHIIGYALFEKVLKIFAGSEIESKVSDMISKIRELLNNTFTGRVIAQLLRKPYFNPYAALQGGCKMKAVQIRRTGTLGMFAKCLIADERQSVGISSGHVALKGNDIQLEISQEKMSVGKCIWPETPAHNANFKDISVILLNADIADTIQYRMPQLNVKLRSDDLTVFNLRRVFKVGAKTNKTHGHLKCKNLLKLCETEAMCIQPQEGERKFSEEGDSGSVVFTQFKRDLIAIGVVFGGELNMMPMPSSSAENPSDFKEGDCIAVDLKDAIRYFESSGKGMIILEKF